MDSPERPADAITDPAKSAVYYKFMDASKVKMAGSHDAANNHVKGIEDYLPGSQYERSEHQEMVVKDILDNWLTLSHNGKFHALFATSSIPEAIIYYRLIKREKPELKVTALLDPTIDNMGGAAYKEDGLVEIITDYNTRYRQDFSIRTHARMKKDIAARLAHKEPYRRLNVRGKSKLTS